MFTTKGSALIVLALTAGAAFDAHAQPPRGAVVSLKTTPDERQIMREAEALLTMTAGETFVIDTVAITRDTNEGLAGCGLGYAGSRQTRFRFWMRDGGAPRAEVGTSAKNAAGCGEIADIFLGKREN